MSPLRCPYCAERLFHRTADGRLKLRPNALIFKGDHAETVCPRCRADVEVDVQLGDDLRKALSHSRRLVIPK